MHRDVWLFNTSRRKKDKRRKIERANCVALSRVGTARSSETSRKQRQKREARDILANKRETDDQAKKMREWGIEKREKDSDVYFLPVFVFFCKTEILFVFYSFFSLRCLFLFILSDIISNFFLYVNANYIEKDSVSRVTSYGRRVTKMVTDGGVNGTTSYS